MDIEAKREEPVAWISYNVLTKKEQIGRMPIQSLQAGVYKHTPLYASPPPAREPTDEMIEAAKQVYYAPPDDASDDDNGVTDLVRAMLIAADQAQRGKK